MDFKQPTVLNDLINSCGQLTDVELEKVTSFLWHNEGSKTTINYTLNKKSCLLLDDSYSELCTTS